ncbi:MAG: nucleotide exchange factor GrpE [Bacteroidia bacterium]|nr:nucleotide exchange factor GrpE [Bacteroidia bacterium]MDW8236265.1 nucleotide exchange factor GrpE [Bacteroidia bacterium]
MSQESEVKEPLPISSPQENVPPFSEGSPTTELEERLTELQQEVERWKDQALRATAELENYRKRIQRDLPQQLLSAQADLLRVLLPVLDSLERGLHAAQEAPDLEKLKQGIQLTHRQVLQALQRIGIEPIAPEVGSLVNPAYHEVLSTVPAAEGSQPHTIIEVVEPGYQFKGVLLRPARVIVAE